MKLGDIVLINDKNNIPKRMSFESIFDLKIEAV